MIKILNLFIKKQISNKTIIFNCFYYFLGHPQSGLNGAKEAKSIEVNLTTDAIIWVISTRGIFIWDVSTKSAFAKDTSTKSIFVWGTWVDVKLFGISY